MVTAWAQEWQPNSTRRSATCARCRFPWWQGRPGRLLRSGPGAADGEIDGVTFLAIGIDHGGTLHDRIGITERTAIEPRYMDGAPLLLILGRHDLPLDCTKVRCGRRSADVVEMHRRCVALGRMKYELPDNKNSVLVPVLAER